MQQRLEVAEETLGQRERELTEARERISSLSDELVISQGKVRGGQQLTSTRPKDRTTEYIWCIHHTYAGTKTVLQLLPRTEDTVGILGTLDEQ